VSGAGTAALSTVGAVAVGAAAAVVAQLPQPTSIWPVTVAGWVTLFVSFASAFGVLYAFHRFSLRPLDDRITRTQAEFAALLAAHRKAVEAEADAFHRTVRGEMNGFGSRLQGVQDAQHAHDGIMDGMRQSIIESREERRYMRETVDEIKRTQLRDQDALKAFEQRVMEALRQYPRDHREGR